MAHCLTIAVLTYQRNAYLAELLPELVDQARRAARTGIGARILVVDNDPRSGARGLVADHALAASGTGAGAPAEPMAVTIDYVHEPVPGIVAGRNRALAESAGSRLLAFIDDDELPSPCWLTELISTLRATGADAVTGPTPPRFEAPAGQWVIASGAFDSWRADDGAVVLSADTGNLLLDLDTVRRLSLSFDPRYGLTGGEDSLFTRQLTRAGGVIRFSARASVTKRVGRDRATRRWVLSRAYRSGSTWARVRVDTCAGATAPLRAGYLVKGLGRAAVSSALAAAAALTGRTGERARHEVAAAGGLGMVAGAVGTRVEEYARSPAPPGPAPAGPGGAGAPSSLTVAVPTYRRPRELERALRGVAAQLQELAAARAGGLDVELLVVDNDPAASACGVVQAMAAEPGRAAGPVRLRYCLQRRPGVAAVRNRALEEAAGRDLLVFIDDDEEPCPGWLDGLLRVLRDSGAQAVAGHVLPAYGVEPGPWIRQGGFFERQTWPTGTPRPVAATNCLLLDLGFVRGAGLRFDEAFGATGGEDALFTRQLVRAGGLLVWCAEAKVVDHVPPERLNRDWVLRRRRSHAATGVRVDLAMAGPGIHPLIRVRAAAGGLARTGAGLAGAGVGRLTGDITRQARGARLAARGRGMLAGSVGRGAHAEYARR